MKSLTQFFLAFAWVLLLISCDATAPDAAGEHEKHTEKSKQPAKAPKEVQDAQQLQLNNGVKWLSDSSTDQNVLQLQHSVAQFRKIALPDLNDYHQAGKALQSDLQTLIKQCRMTGPEHDALHVWLEPLLVLVKNLNAAENTDRAGQEMDEIERRVNLYAEYFQS